MICNIQYVSLWLSHILDYHTPLDYMYKETYVCDMCNIKYIQQGLATWVVHMHIDGYAYIVIASVHILSLCIINVVCIFCQTGSGRCGGKVWTVVHKGW